MTRHEAAKQTEPLDRGKYEMVFCPFEPKNSVLKSKLEEHLKTCPKRRELEEIAAKPWYKCGINFMNPELPSCFDPENREDKLSNHSEEEVACISAKINNLFDKLKAQHCSDDHIQGLFASVDVVQQFYLKNAENDQKLQPEAKHRNQQNKIVDWMEARGLLQTAASDTVFIEYGAGRAGLSSFVAERMLTNKVASEKMKFIIVDRDTRRRKLDHKFREEYLTLREKMDIADFDLHKFIQIKQSEGLIAKDSSVVCIAKHLCGGATDLSITSILEKQSISLVDGVAIATCCHHQCDLKTFCNLEYLKELGGFTNNELQILPRFTSWAITCGDISLDKKLTGFKTKRIIDYARM